MCFRTAGGRLCGMVHGTVTNRRLLHETLPAAAKASFPKCSRKISRMASARMACPLNRPLVSLVTVFFVFFVLLFFVCLRV